LKKDFSKLFTVLIIFVIFPNYTLAKEKWVIDKNISKISFELPVLFAKNVKGNFNDISGFVEIDLENKVNNKAFFTVKINSIDINYPKYKDLILSPTFFNSQKFPIGLLDTKKFKYENETNVRLEVELTIKGISKKIPIDLKVIKLTHELIQILSEFNFSRTDFNIGTGKWQNTIILKDKIKVQTNIFLIRE
tara:strand:+ start:324 stop:899 length:576 start_codon:yes stop_codon:yes gene_type:complete